MVGHLRIMYTGQNMEVVCYVINFTKHWTIFKWYFNLRFKKKIYVYRSSFCTILLISDTLVQKWKFYTSPPV